MNQPLARRAAEFVGALSAARLARAAGLAVLVGTLAFAAGFGLARLKPPAALPAAAPASAQLAPPLAAELPPPLPDFGAETPSPDARQLVHWIAAARDNGDADFVVIDKKHAAVYVFDAQARLRGASPVLIGSAVGDDSVEGIGTRPVASVRPDERTTPAGRFVGERGRNSEGEDVVWVDYDAAVSMHRVRLNDPRERRLERLASPTSADNRISYGCINVPPDFYELHIRPTFARQRALVYVLPEVKTVEQVFGSAVLATTAPARPPVVPGQG